MRHYDFIIKFLHFYSVFILWLYEMFHLLILDTK
jgi:hypothetical protein